MRILILIIFYSLNSLSALHSQDKIRIVIDPGHGGHDPGNLAKNKKLKQEKELNLIIAKKVGDYIEKYLINVEVAYTRTTDEYPSLDDRVSLANKKKADYFLSIHCNDSDNSAIHGTESHVHNGFALSSIEWARIMEKEFSKRAGRHSRGVKTTDDRSHSLQVLKHTKMTSLLVECGFMSNEKEAAYLNTVYGQEIIASAIFRAFRTVVQRQHANIPILKEEKREKSNDDKGDTKEEYSVQIHSSKEWIDTDSKIFSSLGEKVTRKENSGTGNSYKYSYFIASVKSAEEAEKLRDKARKCGFTDAFIIRKK